MFTSMWTMVANFFKTIISFLSFQYFFGPDKTTKSDNVVAVEQNPLEPIYEEVKDVLEAMVEAGSVLLYPGIKSFKKLVINKSNFNGSLSHYKAFHDEWIFNTTDNVIYIASPIDNKGPIVPFDPAVYTVEKTFEGRPKFSIRSVNQDGVAVYEEKYIPITDKKTRKVSVLEVGQIVFDADESTTYVGNGVTRGGIKAVFKVPQAVDRDVPYGGM